MLKGISLQAHPTSDQKLILSQWMGCARFIWNAKCDEEKYQRSFAKRYLPVGTYPEINATFSQYKSRELSHWLFECPSQILRNSATNWYHSYRSFLKGISGRPKRKCKGGAESIYLTSELFRFEQGADGVTRLRIGTKTRDLGYLSIKNHRSYQEPKSIYIKKKQGRYWVSFCFEEQVEEQPSNIQHLNYLKGCSQQELQQITVGVDRGVVRPVQAGEKLFDFTEEQKRKKRAKERYIRRCQRRIARQVKGSKRRNRSKKRLSCAYDKIAHIRKDFCHKTSRQIVDNPDTKVIVLEDLKTQKMTKKGPSKRKGKGAKSALNKAILDKGWHQLQLFLEYKAHFSGKALFKIPAHYTSQECADCGHTHPNNRKSQERFICESCGYSENADRNAAEVIKKRAINLILDSGTELSKRGVLLGSGRGAVDQSQGAIATCAGSTEASKKKGQATLVA